MKSKSGFTLIEVLIVIIVLSILATIGTFSFTTIQRNTRDAHRSADILLLSEALEKYYDQNGEYPGCNTLRQDPAIVTSSVLTGMSPDNLVSPRLETGMISSIMCNDLTIDSPDRYAYVGDDSADCVNGVACQGWVLRYKEEASGQVKEIFSRHGSNLVREETYDNAFTIFIYDTSLDSCGDTITLPISASSPSSTAIIDWGDGSTQQLTSNNPTHTYSEERRYTVGYNGPIDIVDSSSALFADYYYGPRQSFGCLSEVRQWGSNASPTQVNFAYSSNLTTVAEPPHTVHNMSRMFDSAVMFNQNISTWDVSNVTNMDHMFHSADSFNQPIGNWDTSNVTNMNGVFENAAAFNQPLNSWDVSKVEEMQSLFAGTQVFNQPLNNWDTSSVRSMNQVFSYANAFNQDLSSWNTSSVIEHVNFDLYATSWTLPRPNWP